MKCREVLSFAYNRKESLSILIEGDFFIAVILQKHDIWNICLQNNCCYAKII